MCCVDDHGVSGVLWKIMAVGACLLLGACGRASASSVAARELRVPTTEYEVVVPSLGREGEVGIQVCNAGASPREVRVVGVSCGCVQALQDVVVVPGGGAAELKLKVRPIMLYKKRHTVSLACPETGQSWRVAVVVSAEQGMCLDPPDADIMAPIAPDAAVTLSRLIVACEKGQVPQLESELSPPTDSIQIVLSPLREVRVTHGVSIFEAEVDVVGVAETERVARQVEFRAAVGGQVKRATMNVVVSVGPE